MVDIQACAVEGAVGDLGRKHFANGAHAAFAGCVFAFHHQSGGAHPHNHAVAPAVKRQSGQAQVAFHRCRPRGHQARADPARQAAAGHVVAGDDHHAPGAPGADPSLGDPHRLRGRGAGRVDVRVGAACPDVFGKL